MTDYAVRFDPAVGDRLKTLGARDLEIVRENITAICDDPRGFGSHPSGLRVAKPKAWQHKCPHSWVVLFRWQEGDESHPPRMITIENLVECF